MKVVWEDVEDGEYGEVKAVVKGHTITVYSNRLGDSWDYSIDNDQSVGGYETREDAIRDALAEVNNW